MNRKIDKKTLRKSILPYIFFAIVFLAIFLIINFANNKVNTLTYDEFMKALDSEEVTEMTVTTRGSAYTYQIKGKLSDYEENETFVAVLPLSDEVMKKIVAASDENDFKLTVEPDPESSSLLIILVNLLPIVIVLGFGFSIKAVK